MKMKYKFLIISICLTAIFLLSGCDGNDGKEKERIESAFNGININAGGTNDTLENFLLTGDQYKEITATIDFKKNLEKVKTNDFLFVREDIDHIKDNFYMRLGELFDQTTDTLTIISTNNDYLSEEVNGKPRFKFPDDVNDMSQVIIEINRFFEPKDDKAKSLIINTEYGVLTVSSDFFYGRIGYGSENEILKLRLGYETED
jgi:hypothetical protein